MQMRVANWKTSGEKNCLFSNDFMGKLRKAFFVFQPLHKLRSRMNYFKECIVDLACWRYNSENKWGRFWPRSSKRRRGGVRFGLVRERRADASKSDVAGCAKQKARIARS